MGHVVLIGSMAVGKSTTGRHLARRLGRPLRDSDDDIETETDATGRQLAQRHGVATLHRREAQHLLDALADPSPAVIAAAASVVEDERCVAALQAPFVVWLRARQSTLVRRLGADGGGRRRGLGDDPAGALAALEATRAPRYEELADLVIDVDGRDPDEVVHRVLAGLPQPSPTAGSGQARRADDGLGAGSAESDPDGGPPRPS